MEEFNDSDRLACSLTNMEMKERKRTIEKFNNLINNKKEIENGMVFQFNGDEFILEEILTFVKFERKCCAFLTFDLKIQKEKYPIELTISGPEGTKDFLVLELGL